MTECENYPQTEIITYFVQPLNVWVSVHSMLIFCILSMFQECQRVSQQPQSCQIIGQGLNWCHRLKNTVNNDIVDSFSHVYLWWWIIEHSSFESMLDSHSESVDLWTGKVTTNQNCSCLWQVFITNASHRRVHTSSGTKAQMPRMLRTDNTSRLWSVMAYARNRRRPTDTSVITLLLRERYALPWTPIIGGMKRALTTWVIALHILIHYKLLYSNKHSWLTEITMSYISINNNHEESYLKRLKINKKNDYLCQGVQHISVSCE